MAILPHRLHFSSSRVDTTDDTAPLWKSPMFGVTRTFEFIRESGKLLEQGTQLTDSGFRLTRMVTSGHMLEIEVPDSNTVVVPLTGRIGYRTGGSELWVTSGMGALLSRPSLRWSVVDPVDSPECEALVFQFPSDLGADCEETTASDSLLALPNVMPLRVSGEAVPRLLKYLRLLATELSPGNSIAPTARYVSGMSILLDEALQDAIMETLENGRQDAASVILRDLQRARAAEEIIRTRFSEALSVKSMARELGINMRSLQIAFKATHGCSLREMIARVRLENAHTMLLEADGRDQVSNIAWDCGFTHLSRFAQMYRQTYGQSPSETLASSQRAAHPTK